MIIESLQNASRSNGIHGENRIPDAKLARTRRDQSAVCRAVSRLTPAPRGEERVCIEMNYGSWRRHNSARSRMRSWKGQTSCYLSILAFLISARKTPWITNSSDGMRSGYFGFSALRNGLPFFTKNVFSVFFRSINAATI